MKKIITILCLIVVSMSHVFCQTPTISIVSSNSAICSGQSTTLTASGATTYTWNPGNISGNPIVVTPTATTIYTVTGTTGTNSAMAQITVTVKPPFTFSVS